MKKAAYVFLTALCASLAFSLLPVPCAADTKEDAGSGTGRYQIYATDQGVMVLLDTKTGKLWKVNSDASGKLRAEGITVESLAFGGSDFDALNRKVQELPLEGVSEGDKKKCRDDMVSEFSYRLDPDKVNTILERYYKESARR
jgi:hypothetical protein